MMHRLVKNSEFPFDAISCDKCIYWKPSFEGGPCFAGREGVPISFMFYRCVWDAIQKGDEADKFNYHYEAMSNINPNITIL